MKNRSVFLYTGDGEGHPKGTYQYVECGLDNIWLKGGFRIENDDDGECLFIDNEEELRNQIGLSIINRGDRITGREFWFLRQELGLTQRVLAHLLETDVQSIARWERSKSQTPGPADRLMRALYAEKTGGNKQLMQLLQEFAELDQTDGGSADRYFTPTSHGWRATAA
jgi:DNA-binding transcriptional regulator YiaG